MGMMLISVSHNSEAGNGFLQVSSVPFEFERSQYWCVSFTSAFNFCFCFVLLSDFFLKDVFKVVLFHFPLSLLPIERK